MKNFPDYKTRRDLDLTNLLTTTDALTSHVQLFVLARNSLYDAVYDGCNIGK